MVFSCKFLLGRSSTVAGSADTAFGKIRKRDSFLLTLHQGTWIAMDSILVSLPSQPGALVQCTTCTTIYAMVLLAITYHGVSDHVFQSESRGTWFDSELNKASCHKGEDHLSGSLKHWQHPNKGIIQNNFCK